MAQLQLKTILKVTGDYTDAEKDFKARVGLTYLVFHGTKNNAGVEENNLIIAQMKCIGVWIISEM